MAHDPRATLLIRGRVLLVVAAPLEARAVLAGRAAANKSGADRYWEATPLDDRFDLLITGVGKSNAAGALARCLDTGAHGAVINTGVCGALPGPGGPDVGACVLATSSVFADEGVLTPTGFDDVASMGFPPVAGAGVGFDPHPGLAATLGPLADARGAVACVSTCAGTDALAHTVHARTGAIAEAMEGAACAVVCARLGVPFAEVRTVSNTTGDRDRQRWGLRAALARLERLVASLA